MLVGSVQRSKAFRHVWWTSALSRVRSICRLIKYPVSKFSYPAARERSDHSRIEVARFKEPLRSGQRYFKSSDQE
jgi:hypothetical protein